MFVKYSKSTRKMPGFTRALTRKNTVDLFRINVMLARPNKLQGREPHRIAHNVIVVVSENY